MRAAGAGATLHASNDFYKVVETGDRQSYHHLMRMADLGAFKCNQLTTF